MSDDSKHPEQAHPNALDEERLKQLCRDIDLYDAPIFDDPADYADPTQRIALTFILIGMHLNSGLPISADPQFLTRVDEDRVHTSGSKPKRGRGRPLLRRDAEPPTAAGFGVIGRLRELSKGERRLEIIEEIEASPARPSHHVSRRKLVRHLVDFAHRKLRDGETARWARVQELFLNAEPKSIEQSIMEAEKARSRACRS